MKGTDTVTIGATESFAATVKPSVKVSYKSDATDVATVDAKGTVTGVKEGTATITATAKVGTKTVKASKKVEIVNAITAKATTPKKIEVTFAGAIEKADKANFTVTDDKNSASFIKSVTLDESKKVATVEVYTALTSGKAYTVTVKNGEKTYNATFDYVKGTVAKIEAADQYVLADGQLHPIKYTVYDENGLDITEDTDVTIDSTVAVSTASATYNQINLAENVIAYATVVYTNPTNGTQVKSAQFKITGAKKLAKSIDAIVVSGSAVTDTKKWPAKDVNTSTTVGAHDTISVLYTDIWGNKAITSSDVTSLNPELLIVDAKDNKITAIKDGTATVSAKIGEVTKTFTVTVKKTSEATSLALDASSKTTTSLTTKGGNYTKATAVVNVLDQYGQKMAANVTIEKTKNNGVVNPVSTTVSSTATAGAKFEFTPVAGKTGTDYFKATVSNNGKVVSTIYFAISVTAEDKKMAATKFYNVKTNFDLNTPAKDGYVQNSPVAISVVNAAGEAIDVNTADAVSGAVVTLTNNETKKVTNLGTTDSTGAGVTALSANPNSTDNLNAVGTYTLTVTKAGVTLDSIQITVIDSAAKPAVELSKAYVSASSNSVAVTDFVSVPDGTTLNGISFDTNNSNIVESQAKSDNCTAITIKTAGTVTLYNVKAYVTKDRRQFTIDLGTVTIAK